MAALTFEKKPEEPMKWIWLHLLAMSSIWGWDAVGSTKNRKMIIRDERVNKENMNFVIFFLPCLRETTERERRASIN